MLSVGSRHLLLAIGASPLRRATNGTYTVQAHADLTYSVYLTIAVKPLCNRMVRAFMPFDVMLLYVHRCLGCEISYGWREVR